jgi:putative oxidoreductase
MQASSMAHALTLAGRILLAWLFIPAGFAKISGFEGQVAYAASAGLPLPQLGVFAGMAIELVAGTMLLLGWKTRYAAAALALFTVVAAAVFHAYWALPADQAMLQKIMFDKNIAVAGGLLVVMAWGAGAWSVDGRQRLQYP